MKTILDKINKADEIQGKKVELAKHEVELASIKNAFEFNSLAIKSKFKVDSELEKLTNLIVSLNSLISEPINNYLKVISEVDAVEKAAKDLGIELPNAAKLSRDKAEKEITQLNELKKRINSIKL